MSGVETSGEMADREKVAIHQTGGVMAVDLIFIASRGLRSFIVQVCGTCCDGFEIGWVSSVTVLLFYDNIEVGEMVLQDVQVMPDGNDRVTIPEEDDYEHPVQIQHMGAFRAMFDDVMPKKSVTPEAQNTEQTMAALKVSPHGFGLTMTVNLARMPRMRCDVKGVIISGNDITIVINVTNPSPLKLPFESECHFILKKGSQIVGDLTAYFTIELGEREFVFKGSIQDEVSGMATLKGVKAVPDLYEDASWQDYVIGLFETEIDLGVRKLEVLDE